jgi:hypothetical protein
VTIIGIATLLGVAVLAVRTLIGKLPGSRSDKPPPKETIHSGHRQRRSTPCEPGKETQRRHRQLDSPTRGNGTVLLDGPENRRPENGQRSKL